MTNENQYSKISKFLSLILRHKPENINLVLDENGWANVEELIKKSYENGVVFNKEILNLVVETNSKKRFAFNEDFTKIRASQGHSILIDLGFKNQKPPRVLYHGTGEKYLESILKTGLEKRSRQHVHLSSEKETAIKVGQRHGKPKIFEIFAEEMYNDNFEFYLSENGVWLTNEIPVKYLNLL